MSNFNTSNFQTSLDAFQASIDETNGTETWDDISGDVLVLEKAVIDSNTALMTKLFPATSSSATGNEGGKQLLSLKDIMQKMNKYRDDAMTSDERNKNTKYSYQYHMIYLVLKIVVFFILLYFVYRFIRNGNISTETITSSLTNSVSSIRKQVTKSTNGATSIPTSNN